MFKDNWEDQFIKIARFILILIPIILFGWLFDRYFVPSGKLEVVYDFKKDSPFISSFHPEARVEDIEKNISRNFYYQRIKEEPVYFEVKTPRYFQKATVTLEYQNPEQPIFELGIQKSKDEWDFLLRPLENKFIDNSDWFRLEDKEKGIIFLQRSKIVEEGNTSQQAGEEELEEVREKEYQSIDDFLSNLPDDRGIATYRIDLAPYYKLKDYQKSSQGLIIEKSLRGSLTLFTYIKEEPLNFTFYYQDINRKIGPDRFNISVYYGGRKIYQDSQPDDGNIYPNGQGSELKNFKVEFPDLPEGSYQLELDLSDDLVIRKIETKQHLLVFKQKIFLVDNKEYIESLPDIKEIPAQLYSDANRFSFQAFHPNGLQTIKVDNTDVILEEEMKPYHLDLATTLENEEEKDLPLKLKKIYSPRNDVIINANGYFSFTPDSFFLPESKITPLRENISFKDIDFLIAADYSSPSQNKYWTQVLQSFDLQYVYYEDKTLRFILSAPGLGNRDNIKINKIKVLLEKEPITLSNFFPRLKNFLSRNLKLK